MCGIAGVWNRDGQPVEAGTLVSMTASLAHRGPDGQRVQQLGELGLGHRRLSIIDLSAAADQPMATPDESLWLVYNGEIHNYVELRAELRAHGVSFRTESDTEVALWAYRIWGDECFERFNGMWAMAFWDANERRLLLSRDRFGIKPLYYSVVGDRIAFASEIKAILQAFPAEARANWRTTFEFMAGGWPHADDNTFFDNVHRVPPAHNLVFERSRETPARYWTFQPGRQRSDGDAAGRLMSLLDDAVRLRLRSDVPVGVCLSGGLDSSAVTGLIGRRTAAPLDCYSLRYRDPRIDESRYAEAVAAETGDCRLRWVRPRPDEFVDTLEKIVWHYDAPSALRGKYPQWYVMEAASAGSKVVLEGHGADELLGGYAQFLTLYLADTLLQGRGRAGRHRLADMAAAVREIRAVRGRVVDSLLAQLKSVTKQAVAPAGWSWQNIVSRDTMRRFPPPAALNTRAAGLLAGRSRPFPSRFDSALWFELTAAGLPESLHAGDATSMAFGIESRAPFLDHRLVEYCFSLPFYQKLCGGWTKWLLRHGSAGLVPDTVRWRRKKLGYPGAYAEWMTEPRTLAALRDIAVDGPLASSGFFDGKKLERIGASVDRFASFVRQSPERAWRLITLQLWYGRFVASTQGST